MCFEVEYYVRNLLDLPLRSRIAGGGRDDIKKAKSASEFSAANMRENLLKLRENQLWKNTCAPRNMPRG